MSQKGLEEVMEMEWAERKELSIKLKSNFLEFVRFFWESVSPAIFEEEKYHKNFCDELQESGTWVINRKKVLKARNVYNKALEAYRADQERLPDDRLGLKEPEHYKLGEVYKKFGRKHDLIINLPPGTGKSIIISQLFPCWLWANDASIKIISVSSSANIANDNSQKHRSVVLEDYYQSLFPNVILREDQKNLTKFETTAFGFRRTTSVNAKITGCHADIQLIDDYNTPPQENPDGTMSMNIDARELRKGNIWFDSTLSNRKTDAQESLVINIQQRLNEIDLTGHLLKQSKKSKNKIPIKNIVLPAELTDKVSPASWASVYTDKILTQRKPIEVLDIERSKNEYIYNAQFLQDPVPYNGGTMKREWFKVFTLGELENKMKEYYDGVIARAKPDEKEMIKVKTWQDLTFNFYADTAYGGDDSDNSAFMACSNWNGNLLVWNLQTVNKNTPDLVRYAKKFLCYNGYSSNGSSKLKIEPKANGVPVLDGIKNEFVYYGSDDYLYADYSDLPKEKGETLTENKDYKTVPIRVFKDEAPTNSKENRVDGALVTIEAEKVWLIDVYFWGEDSEMEMGEDWVENSLIEFSIFPNGRYKDRVDVLTMAVRNEIQNAPRRARVF